MKESTKSTDTAAATDSASADLVFAEAVTDSAAASDSATGDLGAGVYYESVEDVLDASDSVWSTAIMWELLTDLAAGSDIAVGNGALADHGARSSTWRDRRRFKGARGRRSEDKRWA